MVSESDPNVAKRGYSGYAHLIQVKANGMWDTRAADWAKARGRTSATLADYQNRNGAQVGTQENMNYHPEVFPEAVQAAYANRGTSAEDAHAATVAAKNYYKATTPAQKAVAAEANFKGAYERGWKGPGYALPEDEDTGFLNQGTDTNMFGGSLATSTDGFNISINIPAMDDPTKADVGTASQRQSDEGKQAAQLDSPYWETGAGGIYASSGGTTEATDTTEAGGLLNQKTGLILAGLLLIGAAALALKG